MRKSLLLTGALLIATASVAQIKHKVHDLVSNQTKLELKQMTNSTKTVQMGTVKDVKLAAAPVKAVVARAEGDVTPIVGCATQIYIYNALMGMVNENMVSDFRYYVSDDKAYLSFSEKLGFIEGDIIKGTNLLSEYGADSVAFVMGAEAGVDGAGAKYVYAATTIQREGGSKDGKIVAVRNNTPVIGGYYFAENKELYLPLRSLQGLIGVYPENGTTPLSGSVHGDMDILPKDSIDEYTFRISWTANGIDFDDNRNRVKVPISGGGLAYITRYEFFLQGILPSGLGLEDKWFCADISEDNTQATVESGQYLGVTSFYTDNTRTTTVDVYFEPASIKTTWDDWADAKVFFIDWSEAETKEVIHLIDDGATTLTMYGWSEDEEYEGPWAHMTDLNVRIDISGNYKVGIDEVKNAASASSSAVYNFAGQRVSDNFKGLVIKNGKKFVVK